MEQALAPTLAPGDVVVMDNPAAHKVAGIREAIEAKGAEPAYLPAYSPDLNPSAQVFAKPKALLRRAGAAHGLCAILVYGVGRRLGPRGW